jgi:hypothetical protein
MSLTYQQASFTADMEDSEDEQSRELVQAVKDQAVRLGKITRRLMRLKSFETKMGR